MSGIVPGSDSQVYYGTESYSKCDPAYSQQLTFVSGDPSYWAKILTITAT